MIPLSGYVPSSYQQALNLSEVNVIPPYPDEGVMFAGSSKTQIGATSYRINTQQRVSVTAQIPNTFSTADLYIVPTSKIFYMTDLIIQKKVDGNQNTMYLSDGTLAAVSSVLQEYTLDDHYPQTILHFEVPIAFSVSARFTLLINNCDVRLNCVGWIENK